MKINTSSRYEELFQEMKKQLEDLKQTEQYKDLQIPATGIQNWHDYYSFLSVVREAGLFNLLRIPVEEEMFEIDPNTRKITIPQHFQKNGLGVSGDNNAEIVYFRIPRFFDEMDLALCANTLEDGTPLGECVILWTYSDNGRATTAGIKAYAIDVSENEIIFGWVITNKLTAYAGNFSFAVRISMWTLDEHNTRTYTYSFNTLPATGFIQTGIDKKWDSAPTESQIEDVSRLMNARPLYSGIVNSIKGQLATIVQNLPDNINFDEGKDYATLTVQAYSPDDGKLSVIWYKGNDPIPDTDAKENTSSNSVQGSELQVHQFTYKAKSAGEYWACINNYKSGRSRSIQSNTCKIVGPTEFSIQSLRERNNAKIVFSNNADDLVLTVGINDPVPQGSFEYIWFGAGNDDVDIEVHNGDKWDISTEPIEVNKVKCRVIKTLNGSSIPHTTGDDDTITIRKSPIPEEFKVISSFEEVEGASNNKIIWFIKPLSEGYGDDYRDLYIVINDGSINKYISETVSPTGTFEYITNVDKDTAKKKISAKVYRSITYRDLNNDEHTIQSAEFNSIWPEE